MEFMQNVYVKLHKSLQSFKTSDKFFPNIYAILHKLLGKEKAKEMKISAACAHFWKQEGFAYLLIYVLLIWILGTTQYYRNQNNLFLHALTSFLHDDSKYSTKNAHKDNFFVFLHRMCITILIQK